ncbi:MAG: CsbD family protein [Planctomycetes bacterium]|nr:CsbD family protein [Planctomycetota bacterium]
MAGETDKAKGRIKKAIGELTGDKKLKREGAIDTISGNLKSGIEKVKKALQGKKTR